MKFAKFEEITKKYRMNRLPKKRVDGMDVMLAYGARDAATKEEMEVNPTLMDEPHWLWMFAIGLDEDMDIAAPIRFPRYTMFEGNWIQLGRNDMEAHVTEAAKTWIANNKEAKRY